MRVLITRPEREAATLATALAERGHVAVLAPLFRLDFLDPPADFAAEIAACQAVLLTSANGARALAQANEQRGKPLFAVGDTTAATATGLGFTSVVSASGDSAALAQLVRDRLDPAAGVLLHVTGADVAGDFGAGLAADGFQLRRVTLYDARAVETLPEAARTALQAQALEVATFFSPRASTVFAQLVGDSGLSGSCRDVTAIAISPAAAEPLAILPFKAVAVATRPTREALLEEIDRLAAAVVQGPKIMTDTPSPTPPSAPPLAAPAPRPAARGLGVFGAFITGLIASAVVLGGAVASLPYWPQEARSLWRGPAPTPPAPPPIQPIPDVGAAVDAAKREINTRLDDLDKRVRAAAATAARADRPNDSAVAELQGRIEALENKPAPPPIPVPATNPEADKDLGALKQEVATLRTALAALDQSLAGQKDALDKARVAANASSASEKKTLAAARASAVIGIAARISAALESGLPFTADLGLLVPLTQGDSKLAELAAALQPHAAKGVAPRVALATTFPAVAKAALADDLADDSLWQRLLGKLKGIVSLRRVGADVAGDSVEAKLARAEAAIDSGDLARSVELVKSLPSQTAKATAAWLARAEAHLSAQRAIDQLAAHAVTLLGAAR